MKSVGYFLASAILAIGSPAFAQVKAAATPAGQPASGLNADGKWEGIAVELLSDLLSSKGQKVEFVQMNFADLQSALAASKVEVIAASYGITPERARIVDFSIPYGSYRDVLLVPDTDKTEYRSLGDLKGKRIATSRGSAYVQALKSAGVELTEVSNPVEGISELKAGHVEGVVDNGLQLRYRAKQMHLNGFKVIDSYKPIAEGKLAFAVRKGDSSLLPILNESLKNAEQNGLLRRLKEKWSVD